MQVRSTILIAAVLMAGSVPAYAQKAEDTAQATGKTAASATSASGEKKICKRPEASGTRVIDKICLTKEQWKKLEAEG